MIYITKMSGSLGTIYSNDFTKEYIDKRYCTIVLWGYFDTG